MSETPVRVTREVNTREAAVRGMQSRDPEEFRKYQWKPADALPIPQAPEGVEYRYIRKSIGAEQDVNNFSTALREGWEPVPLSDHPEMRISVNASSANSGLIEVGALILCKRPVEKSRSRRAYYDHMNSQQMLAVDKNLMRENDPRMPLFTERESKVSFGKGQ
jgi:hypothetical protein